MPVTVNRSRSPQPADGAEPAEHIRQDDDADRISRAAEKIRLTYKGVRVVVTGLPSRRSVSDNQKERAAELFDAATNSVSMSTLLWNAKETAVKDLRSVISVIHGVFHDRTLTMPTVHAGLRMIRRNAVTEFNTRIKRCVTDLAVKAEILEDALPGIIERERDRRGKLFNWDDYSLKPTKLITCKWWFPNITEDQDLAELDDEIYQNEIRRVREEMQDVVRRTEAQLAENLYAMLDQIGAALENGDDGKRKIFKDDTVNKLFSEISFLQSQMRENELGGEGIQQAVRRLRGVLGNQTTDTLPDALRQSSSFRQRMQEQVTAIAETLLDTAVPVPRRAIIRQKKADG